MFTGTMHLGACSVRGRVDVGGPAPEAGFPGAGGGTEQVTVKGVFPGPTSHQRMREQRQGDTGKTRDNTVRQSKWKKGGGKLRPKRGDGDFYQRA